MPVEELIQVAGEKGDHVQQPDVLTTPITLDTVDLVALEAARVKLLEEADDIVKISASVLQDKVDTKRLVDRARKNWDESNKALLDARKCAEEWHAKVNEMMEDAHRMRRETIRPRNINFDSATRPKPLATPKDNMKMAAELLAKSDEEINIEHLRTLVATSMQQQSKADTSCRLESNSEACVSTAQRNALGRERRDDQSCTGSTERRRKTKEHQNSNPHTLRYPSSGEEQGKGSDVLWQGQVPEPIATPEPARSSASSPMKSCRKR
jgi:hypothetical protein